MNTKTKNEILETTSKVGAVYGKIIARAGVIAEVEEHMALHARTPQRRLEAVQTQGWAMQIQAEARNTRDTLKYYLRVVDDPEEKERAFRKI